jgi:hypothetical protein
MDLSKSLSKRLAALEARHVPSDALGDRWPPRDCDPKRRLARYKAYFEGRAWICTGTPERKAQNEVRLARYREYFDQLEVDAVAPERP